ncbi:MAG: DUF4031 domain-containing protein [Kineosporiaceae bacterium]
MAILVDPPLWNAHGRRWSHLVSDVSLEELHGFARRLGIPERGFEGDHYDLPEERYASAVTAGAIPVTSRELLRRLRASGLRRSKRRGERVLASSVLDDAGIRVDTLLSPHPPTGEVGAVHVVARRHHDVLALPDGVGYLLPRTATNGVAAPAAGWRLVEQVVGQVVGAPAGGAGLTQVGFLRSVVAPHGPAIGYEVVLQWTAPPGLTVPDPPAQGRWVPAGEAAGLVPQPLASLLRHLQRPH